MSEFFEVYNDAAEELSALEKAVDGEGMRIRITAGDGWYEDNVGDVFTVSERHEELEAYYVNYGSRRRDYFVRDGHYVVVDEEGVSDVVNSPAHYNYGDIEVIDYIEQVTDSYDGKQAYLAGNIIKYVSRAPHKNGSEDIRKAIWYAVRLADVMDREKDAD